MLHDPDVYVDPMRFSPERFLNVEGELDPSVQDPGIICFGFGRRSVEFLFQSFTEYFTYTYDKKEFVREGTWRSTRYSSLLHLSW